MTGEHHPGGIAGKPESLIRDAMKLSFARSGGAGGQNVNKVNTKVVASLPLETPGLFTEEERLKIRERLGTRINADGELVIHVDEERSQNRNREAAVERMTRLIASALVRRKKRRPTRPGIAAREERLRDKKRRSRRKTERSDRDF